MNDLRAAAVQFQHQPGDKSANMEIIREYTAKAATEGANLVVFPEMCITGYWHLRDFHKADLESLAEPVPDGKTTQALLALAKEHELSVGAGLIEAGDDGRLFNTYVIAMSDGRTAKHRKLHTFINQHMDSGDDYTVFDLPGGTIVNHPVAFHPNNRLEADAKTPWPMTRGVDGSDIDMRKIPDKDVRAYDMSYFSDMPEGWYAVTNRRLGVGLGVRYRGGRFGPQGHAPFDATIPASRSHPCRCP